MRTEYDIMDTAGALNSRRLYPAAEIKREDTGPYTLRISFTLNRSPFDVPANAVDTFRERIEYLCSAARVVESFSDARIFSDASHEEYRRRGYEPIASGWNSISEHSSVKVEISLSFVSVPCLFSLFLNFLIRLDKTSILRTGISVTSRIYPYGSDAVIAKFSFPNTLSTKVGIASGAMRKIINNVEITGWERSPLEEMKNVCRELSPGMYSEWKMRRAFSTIFVKKVIQNQRFVRCQISWTT